LSGHGRDVVIPVETRAELFLAVRRGGVKAFGLHPPSLGRGYPAPDPPKTMRGRFGERVPLPKRFFRPYLPGSWSISERKAPQLDPRVPIVGDGTVFPLVQVLEYRGAGIASDAVREAADRRFVDQLDAWSAAGGHGAMPRRRGVRWSVTRALATENQVAALRARIVNLVLRRWRPPDNQLASGSRAVGWPVAFEGSSLTPEDAERFPLFARWFREACPDAPPF
jgi:hypothetical protein